VFIVASLACTGGTVVSSTTVNADARPINNLLFFNGTDK
jgi:hypothetical protein